MKKTTHSRGDVDAGRIPHPPISSPPRSSSEDDRVEGEKVFMRARVMIVQMIGRCERLAEQLDNAFNGQPFLPNIRPEAPENVRRFNDYISRHWEILKLLLGALRLWRISYGADSPEGWTRLLIEDALGSAARPGFNVAPHPPASKKRNSRLRHLEKRGFTKQSH
jgi:hypothetical protein